MIIPTEKINQAKAEYDGQAIKEIMEYFGQEYDGKKKSMLCPFHNDKNASFIWNPKANAFHCFGCNHNYDIIDLYLDQGLTFLQAVQKLFDNVGFEYSFDSRGKQSKSAYRYPKREIENDRTDVENYLLQRKISKKTLDYADIQADEHGNIVFHYYDTNDVLLNAKYRPSRTIKPGDIKCWFQKDSDTTPILFNMNRTDPTKPLVITEGEIDTLSIIEAGYLNVVSVPTGAQSHSWINECWEWLEQFNKIIIWSDNDEPGIKMKNECVRRLGTWRTFYVEIKDTDKWPNGKICKDANEVLYFYGKDRVLEYIHNPIETPIEGVIDLADAEDFDIEQAEGLYTGIQELDDQIYKLVFGTVVLVTGKSGSGKSTLATQIGIAEALNQGYNCFVYSGELPAPILKSWVETNLIGRENITMKNNLARILDKDAREKVRNWYRGRVVLYDDSLGVNPTSLFEKMEEAVRKLGCRVITIDNLMCIDLMCNENERLEAEKNFVKDLVLFAKKFNVLILLLAHPRKQAPSETGGLNLQSVSGSSAIGNLCHMALAVHRYTNKEKEGETNSRGDYIKGCEPKKYDTYIEVIKNRITGLMPKVETYFDFPSYRFYRTPQEVWKKYKWNDDLKPYSDTDPNSHTLMKESPLNE